MGILWTLIIGAVAGWLGSQIFKGGSLGLIGNIIVGIVGGFIGYWLLGSTFGTAVVGQILTGAVIDAAIRIACRDQRADYR